MKRTRHQEGFTLILAMLLLLVFLGLALSLTTDSKSKAIFQGSVKLSQAYDVAADSILERARAGLSQHWVNPDPNLGDVNRSTWRFGGLLARAGNVSPDGYGIELESGSTSINAGMLDITYTVWVANNPDDPTYIIAVPGESDTSKANENWDMDGKVVLTAEIYGPGDSNTPVAVHSVLVGLTGAELTHRYGDISTEGDYGKTLNQGTGNLGDREDIDLDDLRVSPEP